MELWKYKGRILIKHFQMGRSKCYWKQPKASVLYHGVVSNVLDSNTLVSEFEIQWHYYVSWYLCEKVVSVSLLNGKSIFVGYLMPEPYLWFVKILVKELQRYYQTKSKNDKVVYTFPKSNCLKVSVIVQIKFEPTLKPQSSTLDTTPLRLPLKKRYEPPISPQI